MPRRLQHLQSHVAEFQHIAISKRRELVLRLRRCAQADRRADAIAQLQMPRDEIRVQVREKHVLDLEIVLGCERDVLIRIPLRIDHDRSAGLLIADDI